MSRLAREAAVAPLVLWSKALAPLFGPRCRYEPSCARYTVQAIRELGVLRGAILGGWRLLRCNPFSAGGFDPLAERRLFRGSDAQVGAR